MICFSGLNFKVWEGVLTLHLLEAHVKDTLGEQL